MSNTLTARRPGVVTFVGFVLYIKAVMAAVIGIALLLEKNTSELQSITGRDGDFLQTTAFTELIVAVLLFLAASAIMSGQKWARLVVGVVVTIRLAVVAYWMVTHIGGGLHWNALLSAGIGIWVLWALYGNDESEDYFEGHP